MWISLALVYALSSTRCGALLSCYLRDQVCFLVCVNPWMQFPAWFVVGILFGLPSAVVVAIAIAAARRPGAPLIVFPWRYGVPTLFLAPVAMSSAFNLRGIVLGLVAVPVAFGLSVLVDLALGRRRSPPVAS